MDDARHPGLPQSFGELLAPFDRERFVLEHYGKAPLHVPGPAARFERLLGWAGLDGLLAETSLWSNNSIAMALSKETLMPDQYCVRGKDRLGDPVRVPDYAKVVGLMRRGATLVVNYIDRIDPTVRAIAEMIESVLLAPITASAFISWQRVQGYPPHFDTQEVFALQVAGHKAWRLYTGRFDRPAKLRGYRPMDLSTEAKQQMMGEVESRIELAPGDLLYVPLGQFHAALAMDEASLHVSFGIARPTAYDYLSTLLEQLPADPAFRQPLPLNDDPAGRTAWLADLAERVGAAVGNPARTQELAAFQRAKAFERWGGLTVRDRRVVRRFRVRWIGARMNGDKLTVPGRPPATLSPEAAKLAHWAWPQDLIDERNLVAAMAPMPSPAVAQAVGTLVSAGLLEPV